MSVLGMSVLVVFVLGMLCPVCYMCVLVLEVFVVGVFGGSMRLKSVWPVEANLPK